MDIKEKINKEKEKLQNFKQRRGALDEKIKTTEKEIERLEGIINQKRFDEASEVLHSAGLSLEEILKAVQDGNMLALQERIQTSDDK